jgi:hypothetical protein
VRQPTVKRENKRRERNQKEDEEYQQKLKEKYWWVSPQAALKRARLENLRKLQLMDRDEALVHAEERQINLTALPFCLLPPGNYSLLVYLLAFSQIPLCPENGMQFDDIGNMYGHGIFGWPSSTVATKMMVWLLTRWPRIAEVLAFQEEVERKKNM